jgi:hypothetical protein
VLLAITKGYYMEEHETVVVDGGNRVRDERSSASGVWAVIGVIVIVLVILYFMFGGANAFRGQSTGGNTPSVDINAPTTNNGGTSTTPSVTPSPSPSTP